MNECITVGPFLVLPFFVEHHNAMFVSNLVFLNVLSKNVNSYFSMNAKQSDLFQLSSPFFVDHHNVSRLWRPPPMSDSSLDTSGKMGRKLFSALFTTAPRLNQKRIILHFGAKKRRRRRNKAAKSCLPTSHLSLH